MACLVLEISVFVRMYSGLSDSRTTDLLRVRNLMQEGRFDEALLLVEVLEKEKCDLDVRDKHDFAELLVDVGLSFFDRGKLNRAMEYFERGLRFSQAIDFKLGTAFSHCDIGAVHYRKGDLNRALECISTGLTLFEGEDASPLALCSHQLLGAIYQMKGDFTTAFEHFEKDLTLVEGTNVSTTAWVLYYLIALAVDADLLTKANTYLQQFQDFQSTHKTPSMHHISCVAKGLILKESPRLRDKVKAQELFQEVVEDEIISMELTVSAMLNLCELLLDELKAYGEITVLQEVNALVTKIQNLTQQQHSFSLLVDTLILQAKLAMIEGDLTKAMDYLDQATTTAEDKNLGLLLQKVSTEKQSLEEQYEKWQQIFQSNAPLQVRMDQARVENYLKLTVQLIRPLEPPD